MKLSPAFRLRLHASARPLFILAEARLVTDGLVTDGLVPDGLVTAVTRLRRVLATRLLHSRQGWCRRAQTGLRALPLPAFITWQFTMVRSRLTRHLRCTHSSRSTHRIRTRLTSKIPFWVSRKQFLARLTSEMLFRGSQNAIPPPIDIRNTVPGEQKAISPPRTKQCRLQNHNPSAASPARPDKIFFVVGRFPA